MWKRMNIFSFNIFNVTIVISVKQKHFNSTVSTFYFKTVYHILNSKVQIVKNITRFNNWPRALWLPVFSNSMTLDVLVRLSRASSIVSPSKGRGITFVIRRDLHFRKEKYSSASEARITEHIGWRWEKVGFAVLRPSEAFDLPEAVTSQMSWGDDLNPSVTGSAPQDDARHTREVQVSVSHPFSCKNHS